MNTFILILMMHVVPMGNGNSNALTTAEFSSQATCEAAGNAASRMSEGTVKQIKYVCVRK